MIQHDRPITYHTIILGEMTREGNTHAEIPVDEQHSCILDVPAGLPGEYVTIAVEEPPQPKPGRRSRRWKPRPPRVWISEMHRPSHLRVQALCPVFGICGGCQLQHMHYPAQLAWKRATVAQLLHEIGNFEEPPLLDTVPCDDPWHYRNHMRFSVNRAGQPGLTARGTHRVLPLTACPIAHEQINTVLNILSNYQNVQPQVLIRCGTATDQVLIQPQPEIAQQLADAGIRLQAETMEEQLAGETFRIRPSSFFQTNTAQAEKLARMVLAELSGERIVADTYCGVGTFALLLARHVEKVIAIEESPSAIKDAQWNLREVSNVDILKGKVEDLLPALAPQLDGLVIDPPRAGCQRGVLDALTQHPVKKIVYVSCDPSTLTRDLDILCHHSAVYRLRSVQPLDMFPQTTHIECVAILERL